MKLFVFLLFLVATTTFGQSPIIPAPSLHEYSENEDTLFFSKFHFIGLTDSEIDVANSWFSKTITINNKLTSSPIDVTFHALQFSPGLDYYELNINQDGIHISYTSQPSKLYAVSSLLQLVEQTENSYFVKFQTVKDQARFSWRGQHLDVSRHFFTVEEVKQHIDIMAFYKFNTFHWHLTDDQGWRIEIKKYPKLTEIGAFRDSTLIGPYVSNPTQWKIENYGGFYTQEQIKEVVKYATKRNVSIVPEIEMPGHARAALASYPHLGCTEKRPPLIGYWGVFEEIFCTKQETIDFLKDVLDEVIELFPSTYIHIGGDEAPKEQWKKCAVCQKTINDNELKDEHELQSWFVKQFDQYLTSKGKKLIGWDEILEGGLSPNATVMSWQGFNGGIEAAKLGHDVVMTPTSFCYFDYYQSVNRDKEPLSIGGYVSLEKVYNFNPIPTGISDDLIKHILGAQANLWTEYIKSYTHVQYMMYPRALAMIQNLWSVNKPDFSEFTNVLLENQLPILNNWKINYSKSFTEPKFEVSSSQMGIIVEATSLGDFYNIELQYKDHKPEDFYASNTINRFVVQRKDLKTVQLNRIVATEKLFGKSTELKLMVHRGLGLEVQFETEPHSSYNLNASTKLTDGILGDTPWKGSQWVGFQEKEIRFNLNLDKNIKSTSVTLSFLDAPESWILLPQTVQLIGSKNGKKWKEIEIKAIDLENVKFDYKKKIKYLKFVIKTIDTIPANQPGSGSIPFTFIDEIIVE
ncbi:MAG TPA: family 20 glycosylhydrolase [Taishania sp.]|nr:family 20 glycosylhydrolase [Taishania sp.]